LVLSTICLHVLWFVGLVETTNESTKVWTVPWYYSVGLHRTVHSTLRLGAMVPWHSQDIA
jgi:hypothetical protein